MIGKRLAHYEIQAQIGAGGMGEVYRARDTKLGREVALKVLPPDLARDEERLRRFLHEARAVAALNHPNIVTIFSVEEADGIHFLAMELVKGKPLQELIPEDGMPFDRFLPIAVPLIDALSAAHELGVVHRDLKPSNLMLGDDGRIKVLDFGLATFVKEVSKPGEESEMLTRAQLTQEGVVLGTMPYMSPEQIEGKDVDPRSDLFSLGIVFYEMVVGKRPFHGDSSPALLSSILKDTPPPVTALNPRVPPGLARIITRLLEKDPAARYQNAKELASALDRMPAETTAAAALRLPASGEATPALGSAFAQDLFISYAHLDNEAQLSGQEGWVSAFHRSLEVRVGQLLGKKPVIFRDPKSHGEDALGDANIERVPKSALLITVLSPRYVKSEWCHRELQEFVKASSSTGGPKWGSRYRVFKVVKTPTPLERHPPEIQKLLSYEFFKLDPDTGRPRELDQIFGPEAQRDYWARLDDLAHDVVDVLEHAEVASRQFAATSDAGDSARGVAAATESGKGLIYLAQTTYDLKDERDAVRRDLQRHGYLILPEEPLPLVQQELEEFVQAELARSRMSIHLIGRTHGVVPEGGADSIIATQNRLAVERVGSSGFRRVVWIPQGLQPDDDRQRAFLDQLRTDPEMHRDSELLETPLEDLKTVVHQMLQPPARAAEPRVEPVEAGVTRVYLICDQRDQDATTPLADFLFEKGMEVTLPVFEGDEAEVREDHEDNLRMCDAVLLYYGAANELWLRRKLREVQKSAALGRAKRIRTKGIWVAPPSTPQKLRLRSREALVMAGPKEFAPDPLLPFLEALGGDAAAGS